MGTESFLTLTTLGPDGNSIGRVRSAFISAVLLLSSDSSSKIFRRRGDTSLSGNATGSMNSPCLKTYLIAKFFDFCPKRLQLVDDVGGHVRGFARRRR
jgi:hypothetical protein